MYLSWFEKNPEWLEDEAKAFAAIGFVFDLDEDLLPRKLVVFEGCVEADDGAHRLRLIYPPGFPDIGPAVFDLTKKYERHQDPNSGHLCLPDWTNDMTGADCVVDAINLFNIYNEDPAKIVDHETEAPEPASVWFPYEANSSIIIPTSLCEFGETSWGSFDIRFFQMGANGNMAQGVLVRVEDVPNNSEDTFAPKGHLGSGQSFVGTWMKSDVSPPFSIRSFDDLKKWFLQQDLKNSHRLEKVVRNNFNILSKKDKSVECELIGINYREEGPRRYTYHGQWLVGMKLKYGPFKFEGLISPSLLGVGDDYYQRIPSLRNLQGCGVVLVGLGALGSGVALELARAGVSKFLLVDHDSYKADNVVRQSVDLRWSGVPKVFAIRTSIQDINPLAEVAAFQVKLGYPIAYENAQRTENNDTISVFAELVQQYDLIISTVANKSVDFIVNEVALAQKKPSIFSSVLNGSWGGFVFSSLPESACLECYGHHKEDYYSGSVDNRVGNVNYDDTNEVLYARGCNEPTFTGTGFDASIISNLTTRMAVQRLLKGQEGAYPTVDYNLINWNSRGEDMADLPSIDRLKLSQHASCRHHG
jgi:molybdopterin/thiamine biosynthesis adenylyltransferase